ncbi:MAG: DUF4199 domain-containing protein [Ginsengibacter sp.]
MKEKIITTTTKGLVIGLLLIVISMIIFLENVTPSNPVKWLVLLVFIVGIIWSVALYGKQINYNSTLGNYFAHGFKITALVTSLMIIFMVILIFAFPEFKQKAIQDQKSAMAAQKAFTTEQIEAWATGMSKFFTVITLGATLLMYVVVGAIASLVGAIITKKEPNNFVDRSNQITQ